MAAGTRTFTLTHLSLPTGRTLGALQRAQELGGWSVESSSPISSMNSVPPLACSKHALARRHCTRERPPLVPEELRFDQVLRHRGAIEDDEGAGGPGAGLVDGLGEDFFAGARLALDEDVHVGCGDSLQQGVEPPHLGARSDDAPERLLVRQALARGALHRVDAQRGVAEANAFSAVDADVDDAKPVHDGAVERLQIDEVKLVVRPQERRVPPRYLGIGEAYGADGALPDQHAPRLRAVDPQRLASVAPLGHRDEEAACGRPRPVHVALRRRDLVLAAYAACHEAGAYHAGPSPLC